LEGGEFEEKLITLNEEVNMEKKRLALFFTLFLVVTILPLTYSDSTAEQTKKYGGTFIFVDPRGPTRTLGWFAEPGAMIAMPGHPTLESLLDCDLSGNFSPKLATDWNVASDLKSVTLKIRQGVKFHDGSDLTGEVVKWNFDQLLNAKLGPYREWESIDLIDDYTIKINVKTYENTILNTLASAFILSKKAFDEKGKEWCRWNPTGTGPFKFVSFERDVGVKYTKFEDYWQKGKPYVDAIEFHTIADPMTRSAAFLAGDADAVGGDLTKIEYDLVQKGYKVDKVEAGAVCMVPDSKNPDSPFFNIKVREAIDHAIDAAAIVKARGFGWYRVVDQFCAPGHSAYDNSLPGRKYNPEKARQLLAEAGYPNGFKTKIIADSASTDKEAVTAIQGYLSKVGIEAKLDYIDIRTYISYRTGGWNNALLTGAYGFDANLNNSFERYWSQDSAHCPSMLKTDEFQKLFLDSKHSKEFNPEKMKKAVKYLYDNALVLPLYTITRGHVLKPYVNDTGFYSKQTWPGWEPANVWLDKK